MINYIPRKNEKTGLIPRFIYLRNRYLEASGLVVSSVTKKDDDGELLVTTTCNGPETAFRKAGVLKPYMKPPKKYRRLQHSLINYCGEMVPSGMLNNLYAFEFTDPAAVSIQMLDKDIEYCQYQDNEFHINRRSWHGQEKALVTQGIMPFSTWNWRRNKKSGSSGSTDWSVMKFPDNSVVYSVHPRNTLALTKGKVAPSQDEVLTPGSFKDLIVNRADRSLYFLLDGIKGNLRGNADGMSLSKADALEEQINTLMGNIRAAHVIQKPRLLIIRGGKSP